MAERAEKKTGKRSQAVSAKREAILTAALNTFSQYGFHGTRIEHIAALAVPPERKRDGVVYLPCIKPEPRRTIGLVYRPGSPLRSRYEQLAEAIRARMDGHFDKVLKQAV